MIIQVILYSSCTLVYQFSLIFCHLMMCLNRNDQSQEFEKKDIRHSLSTQRDRQVRSAELFLLLQYILNPTAKHGIIPNKNYSIVCTYAANKKRSLTLILNYENSKPDLVLQNPMISNSTREFTFNGRSPIQHRLRERP